MKELRAIIEAYNKATAEGRKTALATIVHVDGSAYRRAGARMLVDDEGNVTGAISGGCLDGDALRKAQLVIAKQKSKLVTYDTSNEEDVSIGIQLGCEGIIQVLFEPIDSLHLQNPIELIKEVVQLKASGVICTFFDVKNKNDHQLGTCIVFDKNSKIILGDSDLLDIDILIDDVRDTMAQKSSKFISYEKSENSIDVFLEFFQPPISLIIVGAGNDAIPLMKIADIIGWVVRVIDGRDSYAKAEKFEAACQVLVLKPEQLIESITINEYTAFVLVTHNYNYDKGVLKYLLPLNIFYIGILGPKKKLTVMLHDLKKEGIEYTDHMLDKVYGPTGLDIGAETPDEIALSMIAEIQAVFQKKHGGSLRDREDVIHDRQRNVFHQKNINGEK